jgi:putative sterol carrier protein
VSVTTKEFFESLPARANGSDRAAGLDVRYVFEIEGGGTWTVDVADGKVSVSEGDGGGDCTISTSEETFERLVAGKQNPLTAYMTGKIKVQGDQAAALKLKNLFA